MRYMLIAFLLCSVSASAYYAENIVHRVFRQSQQKVITNTTNELSLFNDTGALGSRIIPANTCVPGRTYTVKTRGKLSTGSAQDAQLAAYFGDVIIGSSTVTLPNALTNAYVKLDMDIVCRSTGATGSVLVSGETHIATSGLAQMSARTFTGDPVTVDTTKSNAIDFTYKFANALPANAIATEIGYIDER